MICGVHHTALSVKDMERSLAFYRDLLGLEVVSDQSWEASPKAVKILKLENPAARQAMLRIGDFHVELFQFRQPEPAPMAEDRPVCDHGITHICFDIKDVDAEYERLSEAGVSFHSDPVNLGPYCRTAYGRDPDGNVIEFQELFEKARW